MQISVRIIILISSDFLHFQNCQNIVYLPSIAFILTGITAAAETPVKYECDSTDVRDTSANAAMSFIEKFINDLIVTSLWLKKIN